MDSVSRRSLEFLLECRKTGQRPIGWNCIPRKVYEAWLEKEIKDCMNDNQITVGSVTFGPTSPGDNESAYKARPIKVAQRDLENIRLAVLSEFRHYDESVAYEEETLP